jgi:hypothetical protein
LEEYGFNIIVENMKTNQTISYYDGILTFTNNFENLEYEYDMKGSYQLTRKNTYDKWDLIM